MEAVINSKSSDFIYCFAKYVKGADIKRSQNKIHKINNGNEKAKEKKFTLTTLRRLLEEKKYEEILNNKEEYSQLFIDNNQSNIQEITRTRKRNKTESK